MVTALSMVLLLTAGADDRAARAEQLFQKARALLKADQPAEACPLLEKSHALDPALGTLMNLADCEERTNHLVLAYMHFNDAAAWADRTHESQRASIAQARASALKPKLAWVALSTRSPVHGLMVKVNNSSVELGSTPQSVAVDPGEAKITATAQSFHPFTTHVNVAAASTVTLEIPKLDPSDPEALKQPSVADDAPLPFQLAPEDEPPTAPLMVKAQPLPQQRHVRAGPLAMMVGGGAFLAAGIAGLAWSFNTNTHFQNQQPGGPEAGAPTISRATFQTLQWAYPVSWVGAIIGAIALAAGSTWMVF